MRSPETKTNLIVRKPSQGFDSDHSGHSLSPVNDTPHINNTLHYISAEQYVLTHMLLNMVPKQLVSRISKKKKGGGGGGVARPGPL